MVRKAYVSSKVSILFSDLFQDCKGLLKAVDLYFHQILHNNLEDCWSYKVIETPCWVFESPLLKEPAATGGDSNGTTGHHVDKAGALL